MRRRLAPLIVAAVTLAAGGPAAGHVPQRVATAGLHWDAQVVDPFHGGFASISCATADFCRAGGSAGQVWRWDGASWRRGTDLGSNYRISSLSCPTTTFCAAVRSTNRLAPYGNELYRLATLHGTIWRDVPGVRYYNVAAKISCATPRFCVVAEGDGAFRRYDGRRWSAPREIDGAEDSTLIDVSCPATTMCRAIFQDGKVSTYNGRTWTEPTDRETASYAQFDAIDCPVATFCMVADDEGGFTIYRNGFWNRYRYLAPGPSILTLACSDDSSCVAVNVDGATFTWDGRRWHESDPTDPDNGTRDLACPVPGWCAAVTAQGSITARTPDGWQRPRLLDPATGGPTAVSCLSASSCVLVDANRAVTQYAGSGWSAPRRIGTEPGALNDVSCVSGYCATVGDLETFDERAGSGDWTRTADVPTPYDSLATVSCSSATFCGYGALFMFGTRDHGADDVRISRWDWSDLSCVGRFCVAVDPDFGRMSMLHDGHWSAGRRADGYRLTSVSCVSTTMCVAMTRYGRAVRYDGDRWRPISSAGRRPLPRTAVSCADRRSCVAVGATSVAEWDGTQWTAHRVFAPDSARELVSVSCTAGGCVAADRLGAVVVGTRGQGSLTP